MNKDKIILVTGAGVASASIAELEADIRISYIDDFKHLDTVKLDLSKTDILERFPHPYLEVYNRAERRKFNRGKKKHLIKGVR